MVRERTRSSDLKTRLISLEGVSDLFSTSVSCLLDLRNLRRKITPSDYGSSKGLRRKLEPDRGRSKAFCAVLEHIILSIVAGAIHKTNSLGHCRKTSIRQPMTDMYWCRPVAELRPVPIAGVENAMSVAAK
jgi:hypothetical protein